MFRLYEFASVYFFLQTFLASAIVSRLVYGEWQGAGTNKIAQGLNLILVAVSIALFARGLQATRRVGTTGLLAIGLSAFLLVTTLWSVDPDTTIRRSILYFFFLLGVNGMTNTLGAEKLIAMLGAACVISLVASVGLLIVSPGDAIMPLDAPGDPFALRGVFSHKNLFGQVMVCGTLTSLHKLRRGDRIKQNAALVAAFCVAAFASRSGTSFIIAALLVFLSGLAVLFRRGGVLRVAAICITLIAVPAFGVVLLFPDIFLESIGKDPTLTGRTVLWAFVENDIYQRPLLGWGFDAFWSTSNLAAVEISDTLQWVVPEAHNGLLEMLLEVGVIGTLLFVSLWVRNLALAWRCLKTPAQELGITTVLCCLWIFFSGMTEEVLVDPSWPSASVFFATGMLCERVLRANRRQRATGPRPARAAVAGYGTPRGSPTPGASRVG